MNIKQASKLIFEILENTDEIIRVIPKKTNNVNVLVTGIFFTLFDITTDINYLLSKNRLISIPSLIRDFMDSYIDLLLIKKDKNYIYSLLYKMYKEKRDEYDARLKYKDILEYNEHEIEDLQKRLAEFEFYFKESEKRITIKKFRGIKDKYTEVGLLWFYETIYNHLCSHTHNDLGVIEQRHIFQIAENHFELNYLKNYDFKEFKPYILILCHHFYDSLKILNDLLDLKQTLQIDNIDKIIKQYIEMN